MDERPRVGVLGGGQLGRMLIEASNRLNIQVDVLDKGYSPAKQIAAHDGHIDAAFTDADGIRKLANQCDVLTVEIEHVNTEVLEEVSSVVRVEPSWKTIRLIQDKWRQKEHLAAAGIALGEYEELKGNSAEELEAVGQRMGFPLMLKSRTQAYDGRGNYAVKTATQIHAALEALRDRPLYAEKWVDFRMELAVMVVKTKDGVLSFPTVELVSQDSICKLCYAPARQVSQHINEAAQKLAKAAVATFEGKGVYGVELFLTRDDTLLVNGTRPSVFLAATRRATDHHGLL